MNYLTQFAFFCERSPGEFILYCDNPVMGAIAIVVAALSSLFIATLGAMLLLSIKRGTDREVIAWFHLLSILILCLALVVLQLDLSGDQTILSSAIKDLTNLLNPTHSIFSFFVVSQLLLNLLQRLLSEKLLKQSSLYLYGLCLLYLLSFLGAAFIY